MHVIKRVPHKQLPYMQESTCYLVLYMYKEAYVTWAINTRASKICVT